MVVNPFREVVDREFGKSCHRTGGRGVKESHQLVVDINCSRHHLVHDENLYLYIVTTKFNGKVRLYYNKLLSFT